MPRLNSEEIGSLLESGEFDRVVLQKQDGRFAMILYGRDGTAHIHANLNGRIKEYRHLSQATEWLERKFGITEYSIEVVSTG